MMPVYLVFFGCLALIFSYLSNTIPKFSLNPQIELIDLQIQIEAKERLKRSFELFE